MSEVGINWGTNDRNGTWSKTWTGMILKAAMSNMITSTRPNTFPHLDRRITTAADVDTPPPPPPPPPPPSIPRPPPPHPLLRLLRRGGCRRGAWGKMVSVKQIKFKQAFFGVKACAMDVGCYNDIIGRLSKEEGWVGEAEKLFDEMPSRSVAPDATTYGYLINGYFREGKPEVAFRCLGKIVSVNVCGTGLKVDVGFYARLVVGLVEEAVGVVSRMLEGKLVAQKARLESVVMALCREVRIDGVRGLLEEMAKE